MTDKGEIDISKKQDNYIAAENENIHKTSKEYLNSLTQRIFTQEHIYTCVDCLVFSTNNIDDEYVIIVLEIMDEKLKTFYGGDYLIQQWIKKKKIFQKVHTDEHDFSVYVDPKQALVTLHDKIMWAQLKIESIIALKSPTNRIRQQMTIEEQQEQEYEEEERQGLEVNTTQVTFYDIMENCEDPDKPDDIVRIFDINNEGFRRKDVHIQLKIQKVGTTINFDLEKFFEFNKSRISIDPMEKLRRISMENVSDTENIITLHRENGEVKVINEKILIMMDEFEANQKIDEEEEEEELPPPPPPRNAFQRFLALFQRENNEQNQVNVQKSQQMQDQQEEKGILHMKSRLGAQLSQDLGLNKIVHYFNRRSILYFKMQNGEMKKVKLDELKSFDPLNRASKLSVKYQEALLQDVSMHISFFKDFLIANTTLIICHGKVLSILDFQTNTWDHLLPKEQLVNQEAFQGQSYFGQPDGEIDQLLLNHIFSNTIYDCIIKYQGLFMRRLKYYNELNKTYFEKGKILENFNVNQIIKNQGSKNYRLYGEIIERTFFLIEDQKTGIQQIWLSQNGSKITKLIEYIKDKWKIMEIPNAPSDMLPVYSVLTRTLTIYTIKNMQKLYRPNELLDLKTYEIKNFISFDPNAQYFFFDNKLYYNHFGNIEIIDLTLKNPLKTIVEISFDQQILSMYMTDPQSVYFKDKKNVFRIANIGMQKSFNLHSQPSAIFHCDGAFLNKIDYGPTLGRLGVFNSPFDISILPCLDKCRIDMIASQEFDQNFVCYKEEKNRLYAIKKPNQLITWNTDNGLILNSVVLKGLDYENYKRYSEWNGITVLKQRKDVSVQDMFQNKESTISKDKDKDEFNDGSPAAKQEVEQEIIEKEILKNPNQHVFIVVEIKSESVAEEHCQFVYEYRLGLNIYVSLPYMLAMDENCTKMYAFEGSSKLKTLKPLKTFYEPQMKVGKPIYFSPNFIHRLFIDANSKKIMINHSLTNKNIIAFDIKKQLMFQKKKTHPMIYFHDDEQIMLVTHTGIEKIFKIVKIPAGWFSKARIELQEQSYCYYNESSFLRRFMIDSLNFNNQIGIQNEATSSSFKVGKINLMKFRADILQRHLKLNIYKAANLDNNQKMISRFYTDKNISLFNHFIIDNYRKDMSFNYLSWRVIEDIENKKISVKELSDEYIEELLFTILPNHKTIFHYLQKNQEALNLLIEFIKEDPDEFTKKSVTISDIPFIPDVKGVTPLHKSLKKNNASMTDQLIMNLKDACFDHHCKYIMTIYHELLESVPASMTKYLDSRLISTPWVSEYTRGRVEPLEDTNFVMNTFTLWDINLKENLDKKLLNTSDVNEQPLTVYVFDIPDTHKYLKDNADNFLEALANTDQIDIFESTTVRAIIEMKWPLVRKGIIKRIFIPYVIFVLSFLLYSTYIFEAINQQNTIEEKNEQMAADNSTDSSNSADPSTLFAYHPSFHPPTTYFSTVQSDSAANSGSSDSTTDSGDTTAHDGEEDDQPQWRQSEAFQFLMNSQKQIFKAIILLLAIYFFMLEFRQFVVVGPANYLGDPWNYIDLIPLALISTCMVFEYVFSVDPSFERPLNAISCFFMWVKFLYLLRIFRQTSKFISMIEAVIFDMKDFLVVFFITLCGFSQAMYILSNANVDYTKTEADYSEENPNPQFIFSLFDSIFFSYRMSLGDFDTGNLGVTFQWMSLILFVLATMFLTIVMLNLLIAVISSTYERVRDTSVSQMYKTMADLTAENEYLVPDSHLAEHDEKGDYLYIAILDENNEDVQVEDEQIQEIRKTLLTRSRHIEEFMKDTQQKLVSSLQQSTDKQIAMINDTLNKNEQRMKHFINRLEGGEPPSPVELDRRRSSAVASHPDSKKHSSSNLTEAMKSPLFKNQ